ncbi:uncharacterized protein LOC108905683 isoform X6 [Anoplophora glabripennis]|uniref:uncharacterized protein LOC108905683 isoform X6 n=1 Tax=Anoplophora glabripennis TaxID=217634 RepID=UPI0008758CCD|nr:uncharacterized protein LOC108905683 isoform X6 [Anoplophora glabripennis]
MFLSTKSLPFFLFFVIYCHVIGLLDKYESGNYSFQEGTTFQIFKPDQSVDSGEKGESVSVSSVEGRQECLGITTEISETIVLDCPETQPNEPGCFYIFSPSDESGDAKLNDETQIEKACVEVLNERCVGIVTPKDWTLPLHCIESAAVGNS